MIALRVREKMHYLVLFDLLRCFRNPHFCYILVTRSSRVQLHTGNTKRRYLSKKEMAMRSSVRHERLLNRRNKKGDS